MIFKTILVSHFEQNCRLIIDETTSQITIIDPGNDVDIILAECNLSKFTIQHVILTHCHLDHGGGVKHLISELSKISQHPTLYYHSKDQLLADHIQDTATRYGLSGYDNVPKTTTFLDDLKTIDIGSSTAEIRFTPGHAPGHIVLFFNSGTHHLETQSTTQPILIAGDTLFRQSIGRTDLPFGNPDQLLESIQSQLFTLPDDTIVLPGHGPNTTIGFEKLNNPFF
jgi:hydroxyacylglutathione hydrolase